MSEGSSEGLPKSEINPQLDEWGELDRELEGVGPENPLMPAFDDLTEQLILEFQEKGGEMLDINGNPTEHPRDRETVEGRIRVHENQIPGYGDARTALEAPDVLPAVFSHVEKNLDLPDQKKQEVFLVELIRRRNTLLANPKKEIPEGRHRSGQPPEGNPPPIQGQ